MRVGDAVTSRNRITDHGISWNGTGKLIESYSVDLTSKADDRIIGTIIFYSEKDIYTLTEKGHAGYGKSDLMLKHLTMKEIFTLIGENRAKFVDDCSEQVAFNQGQKDIYSAKSFCEGVYYVYGAAVSASGILDIATAQKMIITEPVPKSETDRIGDGIGTIMPAGGNTSSSDPNSAWFYEYIRIASGGGTPRIAMFSSSRETLSAVINHYYYKDPELGSLEDNFRVLGFEPVFIPLSIDTQDHPEGEYHNYVAESDYWAGVVKTCAAVYLQGGDQSKHAKTLLRGNGEDTLLLRAIRYVYDRGGVVAGTSAGMHVMSDCVFGYGIPAVVLETNSTEEFTIKEIPASNEMTPTVPNNNIMHSGAALLPLNVLTDTHFDDRGRLGRLIVALRDTGARIGIGADEGTAFPVRVIDGEMIGEVIGNHGIFIVDPVKATYSAGGMDLDFEVADLLVHYLSRGDQYHFGLNKVVVSNHKVRIVEEGNYVFPDVMDPFYGDYGSTKCIQDFVKSDVRTKRIADSTGFDVTFKKENDFFAYVSEDPYVDSDLLNYNHMTVVNLVLSVAKHIESFDVQSTTEVLHGKL